MQFGHYCCDTLNMIFSVVDVNMVTFRMTLLMIKFSNNVKDDG